MVAGHKKRLARNREKSAAAEFQRRTMEHVKNLYQNEKALSDMCYTASVNIAVIRKLLAEKLDVDEKAFMELVDAELAERKRLMEAERKKEVEQARAAAVKEAAGKLREGAEGPAEETTIFGGDHPAVQS